MLLSTSLMRSGGTHKVQSCSFKNLGAATVFGPLDGAHVTIGGAASKGNVFENVYYGCEIDDLSNCTLEISHNQISDVRVSGMAVTQGYLYGFINEYPSEVSQLMIRHNIIQSREHAHGVDLIDYSSNDGGAKLMNLNFMLNEIQVSGDAEGIYCLGIKDAFFNSNKVYGSALFGTSLENAAGCNIVNNNYEGFVPAYADIILTGSTMNNKVVCGRYESDVWDFGTDNDVVCPGFDFRSDASNTAQNMETLTERRANTQFPWLIKK